jgi:selenocysteine lyase/cysteine desulfurase
MLIVDACQGAGAIALDPRRDGFDVLVADSYKWLMGPRGMGYMYISPEARQRFEPVGIGWRSGREPQNSYYGVEMDLSSTASRFDSSLSWISVVGDRESLGLLTDIGIHRIEAHDMRLAERFRAGLDRIGIPGDGFTPPERSQSVAVALKDAKGAVERLRSAGVVAAQRGDMARLSFHVFNDDADVDTALNVLEAEARPPA